MDATVPVYFDCSGLWIQWVHAFVLRSCAELNCCLVALTVLAFLLENSGLLKAGRQSMKYEPQTGSGVKFSDVHGVDEAKEVSSSSV